MHKMDQLALGIVLALCLTTGVASAKGFFATSDVVVDSYSDDDYSYTNNETYSDDDQYVCTGPGSCVGGSACGGTSINVASDNSCNAGNSTASP